MGLIRKVEMSKFKVGQEVYWYKWRGIGSGRVTKIVRIIPKRWWQRQRYQIDDNPNLFQFVYEKDLFANIEEVK